MRDDAATAASPGGQGTTPADGNGKDGKGRARRLRVGIALSAGAARGLAHLGVMRALAEAGIGWDMLAGTSMGAAVAVLTACGQDLGRLCGLVERLPWERLIRLGVPRMGLIRTDGIAEVLRLLIREKTLEALAVPTYVVACDIERGKRVVLDRGPAVPAVVASCAIPGIFPPVRLDGRLLVDGGVLDRLPAGVLRERGADFVIAVDAGLPAPSGRIRNLFDCILQSIDLLQREVTACRGASWDILIRPDLGLTSPTRFDLAGQFIQAGYEAGRAAVPEIRDCLLAAAAAGQAQTQGRASPPGESAGNGGGSRG